MTIGIALFLLGIYYIGETKKLFSTTFRLTELFNDVDGLQVGNNIRFAGINVGTVEAIEIITDSTVQVDIILYIKTQKFIKKDAKAIIGSDGLMGNKILNVSPGTEGYAIVVNNDMIGTTIPISLDQILLKLKTTTDNSALITNDLASIIGNIRSGKGTIGKLFMDTVFAENLDKTIVNVKQGKKVLNKTWMLLKAVSFLKDFLKRKLKKQRNNYEKGH